MEFIAKGVSSEYRQHFPESVLPQKPPERRYFILTANCPLGVDSDDIKEMITDLLKNIPVKYEIVDSKNIQHQFDADPPIKITTGLWETQIITEKPINARQTPIPDHSTYFMGRYTPVRVFTNSYDTRDAERKQREQEGDHFKPVHHRSWLADLGKDQRIKTVLFNCRAKTQSFKI